MSENPLDFSPLVQEQRYHEFYSGSVDPESILRDQLNQVQYLRSVGFDPQDVGYSKIPDIEDALVASGIRPYFDDDLGSRLYTHSVVYDRVMAHPGLLLQVPEFPPSAEPLNLRLTLNLDALPDDIVLRRSAPTIEAYQQAKDFIERFQLPQDTRYGALITIAERLESASHAAREVLYMRFVAHQASELLISKCPSLRDDLHVVLHNLVLLRTNVYDHGSVEQALEGVGHYKFEGVDFISYQLNDKRDSFIDNDHSFRILVIAHELVHAVVDTYMQTPSLGHSFIKRFLKHSLTPHELWMRSKIGSVNSYTVLQEMASLFFEHELIENMNLHQSDLAHIHKITQIRVARQKHMPDYGISMELHPDNISNQQRYIVGWELVKTLKNNGWNLRRFPVLLDKIIRIIDHSDDSDEPTTIKAMAIDYSKDADSPFQQLMAEITSL